MAFSVLTAAQGATLRRRIGDAAEVLSDAELDALYTASGADLDMTTVMALQELIGYYAMKVDITDSNSLITERRGAIMKNLADLLKYWEKKTGGAGVELSTGTIDTGIDYEGATT